MGVVGVVDVDVGVGSGVIRGETPPPPPPYLDGNLASNQHFLLYFCAQQEVDYYRVIIDFLQLLSITG